jgi:DNA mismatch repair protein MutS
MDSEMTLIEKATPAQRQYLELRKQYSDCILFFRMGDFYETFYDDAKVCSKILDLTLTARDKQWNNPIPMAWVPYHSVDKYIAKMVAHGYKVALAEQMTEPKAWQIVERKVTQVITPATFIEESKKEFTYIASITYTGGEEQTYHCARWDVTVWSYWTQSFYSLDILLQHIRRIWPSELVIDIDFPELSSVREYMKQTEQCLISIYDKPADPTSMIRGILWVQTLQSYGKALEQWRQTAMALLCNYLQHIQPHSLKTIVRIQYHAQGNDVMLDMVTVKNLEIVASQYEWSKQYGLLGVLDRTSTALGARLFRDVLLHPTQDLHTLTSRQQHIKNYTQRSWDAKHIQMVLRHMVDMPKIISTLLYKKSSPLIFWKLRYALSLVYGKISDTEQSLDAVASSDARGDAMKDVEVKNVTAEWDQSIIAVNEALQWWIEKDVYNSYDKIWFSGLHKEWYTIPAELEKLWLASWSLSACEAFYGYLTNLLKDEWLNDDIDYVRDGYSSEIDELRRIAYHSDSLLLAYQQELVQATGVQNIKVKYITNQWYTLEVTPKDVDVFEATRIVWDPKRDIIRRQTLKTGQRYTTLYLDELQNKVLSAQFQLRSREQALIEEAKQMLISIVHELGELAEYIAWLDVYTSHALFAIEKKYVKPELLRDGELCVVNGRHPVIEEYLPHDQDFIPNDLTIGGASGGDETGLGCSWNNGKSMWNTDEIFSSVSETGLGSTLHIVTGPNMGGKSTFLRQNALIVLMAHCGLYVPAEKSTIPLIDGLFARVWSGDVIAKNQSTFMTEMIEMANILHNATNRSFIILDELGRGTSTYDGMALAQAIVQYIVQHIGAKTLFATHYHELISLEQILPGVKNYSVSVYETEKDVVFMKKIISWWASKSYGLDVAKIAGIPSAIVETARKYLSVYESHDLWWSADKNIDSLEKNDHPRPVSSAKTTLFDMEIDRESINAKTQLDKIKRLLDTLDPNNMTPMQALQMIAKIKGEV